MDANKRRKQANRINGVLVCMERRCGGSVVLQGEARGDLHLDRANDEVGTRGLVDIQLQEAERREHRAHSFSP